MTAPTCLHCRNNSPVTHRWLAMDMTNGRYIERTGMCADCARTKRRHIKTGARVLGGVPIEQRVVTIASLWREYDRAEESGDPVRIARAERDAWNLPNISRTWA